MKPRRSAVLFQTEFAGIDWNRLTPLDAPKIQ